MVESQSMLSPQPSAEGGQFSQLLGAPPLDREPYQTIISFRLLYCQIARVELSVVRSMAQGRLNSEGLVQVRVSLILDRCLIVGLKSVFLCLAHFMQLSSALMPICHGTLRNSDRY